MVNPTFNIGGLASGLDTSSIIDQLVQLERQPIVRYQQQQTTLRRRDDAWGSVVTNLSGLRSSLDAVAGRDALQGLVTATSSNEDAVRVTVDGAGSPGTYDFTVSQLASRQRTGFTGSYGAATAAVGAGTLQLTVDGEQHEITTNGSTTLLELSRQIDGLDIGVDAQVLKVAEGDFQLVLTAKASGEAGGFTATTDIAELGAANQLQAAADAVLQLGSLEIRRSSNTITDLVEGATITLRSTTAENVTVNVEQDTDKAVESVKELVAGFNKVLDQLKTLTKYDPETGKAGILQGDRLARDLAFDLRSTLTTIVDSGSEQLRFAGDLGIELTRDGRVELDEGKLREQLGRDYGATVGFLTQSLSGDAGVGLTFAGDAARSGAIEMEVTQEATSASTGDGTYEPNPEPMEFQFIRGGGDFVVDLSITANSSHAEAVAQINTQLAAAGVADVRASANGDALRLASSRLGSAGNFTIGGYDRVVEVADGGILGGTRTQTYANLDGDYEGQDIQVDFGAEEGPVTGTGTSVEGNGAAEGLVLDVTGGATTYSVRFSGGLGGAIGDYLAKLEGRDGLIQTTRNSLDSSIRDFDEQIERFEQRVSLREVTLRRQFSGLESTLSTLQSQGNYLASQLAGLVG